MTHEWNININDSVAYMPSDLWLCNASANQGLIKSMDQKRKEENSLHHREKDQDPKPEEKMGMDRELKSLV